MKNSNDTTWDRNSDLPSCSTANLNQFRRNNNIKIVLRGNVNEDVLLIQIARSHCTE